jgi:histidinol-phosphate/aromatic aminotransferase/cobyric acid decarboxylase-like protein
VRLNLKSVPVVDRDGKRLFEVTKEQAIAGIRAGHAFAVDNRAIRLKDKPGPKSAPALSSADAVALACAKTMSALSTRRRERLEEWKALRAA